MEKKDFIKVLECILKCADERIVFVNLYGNYPHEHAIEVVYDEDLSHTIPIIGKSLLGILYEVAEGCYREEETEKLRTIANIPNNLRASLPFEDWKKTKKAKDDLEKLEYYLYRMSKVQKDYIFGKMALMLLSKDVPTK